MKSKLVLLLLFWTPLLYSQSEEAPSVTMRIRFLSLEDREVENLWFRTGEEWIKARIPSEFLAKSISYTGPANFNFYRKVTNEEGVEEMQPAGRVLLDPKMGEVLILVSVAESGQVQGRTLDIGTEHYSPGSYMVFNFCDRKVALGMAGEVNILPPEATRILSPPVEGREPISIQFIKAGDKDKKSLVTTTWFHNPRQRKMVFLVPEEERIRVKSLTLYPEPVPEPSED